MVVQIELVIRCTVCRYKLYWRARRREWGRIEPNRGRGRIDCLNGWHDPTFDVE